MIDIPKKYARVVSWLDFLLVFFLVSLAALNLTIPAGFFFTAFVLPALLVVSGCVLLKNKTKFKYKKAVYVLCMAAGAADVFYLLMVLFGENILPGFFSTAAFLSIIQVGGVFSALSLLLLTVSGFYLRKIS